MSEDVEAPILYKCPYCVRGRFTAADGWAGAVRHIREEHQNGSRKRRSGGRRRRLDLEDLGLLETASLG